MSRDRLSSLAAREAVKRTLPQAKAAVIRTTALDVSDALYVTITADSPTRLRGPIVGWPTRGDTLPTTGDPAAVVELDDSSVWILGWYPFGL